MKMRVKLACLVAVALALLARGTGRAQTLEVGAATAGQAAHEEWALQVLFTKDGGQFVSAGLDGRVRFWEVASGKLTRELKAASGRGFLSLALSPDGRLLAAGDTRGGLSVWEVSSGKLVRELKADSKAVNAVAFTADGAALAAGGSDGVVRFWPTDARPEGEKAADAPAGTAFAPPSPDVSRRRQQ